MKVDITRAKTIQRDPTFLDESVFRLDISSIEDSREAGRTLGSLISKSFGEGSPVKEIFLYGGYCSGKSSLSDFIFQGFSGSEGLSIKRQTRMQRFETTMPKCTHIDYRLHSGNPIIWKMVPEYAVPDVKDGEILIGEWCEFLPAEYFLADRLMLEVISASSLEKALAKKDYMAPLNGMQAAMMEMVSRLPRARVLSIAGFGYGKDAAEAFRESDVCKKLAVQE